MFVVCFKNPNFGTGSQQQHTGPQRKLRN